MDVSVNRHVSVALLDVGYPHWVNRHLVCCSSCGVTDSKTLLNFQIAIARPIPHTPSER